MAAAHRLFSHRDNLLNFKQQFKEKREVISVTLMARVFQKCRCNWILPFAENHRLVNSCQCLVDARGQTSGAGTWKTGTAGKWFQVAGSRLHTSRGQRVASPHSQPHFWNTTMILSVFPSHSPLTELVHWSWLTPLLACKYRPKVSKVCFHHFLEEMWCSCEGTSMADWYRSRVPGLPTFFFWRCLPLFSQPRLHTSFHSSGRN